MIGGDTTAPTKETESIYHFMLLTQLMMPFKAGCNVRGCEPR